MSKPNPMMQARKQDRQKEVGFVCTEIGSAVAGVYNLPLATWTRQLSAKAKQLIAREDCLHLGNLGALRFQDLSAQGNNFGVRDRRLLAHQDRA